MNFTQNPVLRATILLYFSLGPHRSSPSSRVKDNQNLWRLTRGWKNPRLERGDCIFGKSSRTFFFFFFYTRTFSEFQTLLLQYSSNLLQRGKYHVNEFYF